ncbi:hypothetical protein HHI36_013094 [Cryptolaemus montrouzieri]|uniref:CUB domain-containing protein n=1 Tax=Cryptolaemus montrouzieri TaxID=559131 RepID=A0ABD2NGU8_9CUCU
MQISSCLNRADIIRVYDGKTSTDPAITILCNEGTEIEIFSTGPDLFLEFVANSDQPGRGFRSSFQFQQGIDNSIDLRPPRPSGPLLSDGEPSASETRKFYHFRRYKCFWPKSPGKNLR